MTRSWVGTITAGSANHSHKHQKLDLKSQRSCKILPYSPHSYFKIFSHKSAHRENLHECHVLMVKYEHPGLNFQLFTTLSLLGVPHALETQKSATKACVLAAPSTAVVFVEVLWFLGVLGLLVSEAHLGAGFDRHGTCDMLHVAVCFCRRGCVCLFIPTCTYKCECA